MAVFLVVVLVSLNFLYKAGKITSEKMRLQNAADAAAYSVSVIEARDLNFAAYINRAMIANEVAIGQLVGLHSWAFHWNSFGYYLAAYAKLFISPIFPPVTEPLATGIASGAQTVFQVPGNILIKMFRVVANIGTTVLHNINKVYGYAQQGFHFASVLYAISVIDETIERNDPDAKISDYGMLALIGHAATYGAIPSIPGSFVKTYRSTRPSGAGTLPASGEPEPTENQIGMQRFAAMTRASRDDFSMRRGWRLPLYIPSPPGVSDALEAIGCMPTSGAGNPPIMPLDCEKHIDIDIPLAIFSVEVDIDYDIEFKFSLDRFGGSELRYKGANADGRKFGWSAADTTGLSVHFLLSFDVSLSACIGIGELKECATVGPIGATAQLSAGYLDLIVRASLLGFDIEVPLIPHIPFPTSAPFASGSSQVGSVAAGNFLTQLDLNTLTNSFDPDDYGRAHQHSGAWQFGVPFIPGTELPPGTPNCAASACTVPVVMMTMPFTAGYVDHKPNKSYKGLPSYIDTVPQTDPWGFEAPYLIVGLVKEIEDVWSDTAPDPTGNLALTDRPADGELAAIAKSEVYFKRPNDLPFFARADGYEEYGSAFNPYWNARLVETTHADRMTSLLIQQKEFFYELPVSIPELPDWGDIVDWLPL